MGVVRSRPGVWYPGMVTVDQASVSRMAGILTDAERVVVLSGAGISTPSGIPDFRSAGGLWERYDPMEVASIQSFVLRPRAFWRFWHETWHELHLGYEPNPAHRFWVAFERSGKRVDVVTQNIDGLHEQAGSSRVHAVHGTTRHAHCAGCGRRYSWEQVSVLSEDPDGHLSCTACGNPVKPAIVLFGEDLPSGCWNAASRAVEWCDTLVVVGTSLTVYPVAGLPRTVVRYPNRHLVICNTQPTDYDGDADLVVRGDVGAHFAALADAMGLTLEPSD